MPCPAPRHSPHKGQGERPHTRSPAQSTFSCQRARTVRQGKDPDRPQRSVQRRSPSIRGIPKSSRPLTSMLSRGLWTNDFNVHTLVPRERAVKTPTRGPASFSGPRPRSIGGLQYGLRSFFLLNRLTFPGGNGCGRRGNGSFPRLLGTFPKGNQRFPVNAHDARALHVLFPVRRTMRGRGNGPFPLGWEARSAGNAMERGPRLSFPGGNGSRRRGNGL